MATNDTGMLIDTGIVIETWQKNSLSAPAAWLATTLIALLAASVFFMSKKTSNSSSSSSDMPLMNPRKFYDLGGIRAKLSFVFGARRLLALGVRTGRPFRLLTDLGEMIVLPARYANEIRNDPRLSFSEVIVQVNTAPESSSKWLFFSFLPKGEWTDRMFCFRPCRISMPITPASKASGRAPRMPISVVISRITSSRILSVGAGPAQNYKKLV